jgi:hypothetical protein
VQIFPQFEFIVVTKCRDYLVLLSEEQSRARTNDEATLRWKEETAKRNDYNSRMNGNCYGPASSKECFIEKIKYGADLNV